MKPVAGTGEAHGPASTSPAIDVKVDTEMAWLHVLHGSPVTAISAPEWMMPMKSIEPSPSLS